MTTATAAYNAIRARIEAQVTTIPLRWQNEDGEPLPDSPTSFAYIEFTTVPAFVAMFGGGRSQNRYRNIAQVDAYVFVPRGVGLAVALDAAETIAAALRSYRDSDISCFDATVRPGGSSAESKPPGMSGSGSTPMADNYFWATAEVALYFDQIG